MASPQYKLVTRFSPSREGLERNISLVESELFNINPCGETSKASEVYCILTKEDVVLYYLRDNGSLKYVGSDIKFSINPKRP